MSYRHQSFEAANTKYIRTPKKIGKHNPCSCHCSTAMRSVRFVLISEIPQIILSGHNVDSRNNCQLPDGSLTIFALRSGPTQTTCGKDYSKGVSLELVDGVFRNDICHRGQFTLWNLD